MKGPANTVDTALRDRPVGREIGWSDYIDNQHRTASIRHTQVANWLLVLFRLLLLRRFGPKTGSSLPIRAAEFQIRGSFSRKGICENERRV